VFTKSIFFALAMVPLMGRVVLGPTGFVFNFKPPFRLTCHASWRMRQAGPAGTPIQSLLRSYLQPGLWTVWV